MKRALVTGSAGFVGRHMVAELKSRGFEVVLCDIADEVAPRDALDLFATDATRYDLVVHCAAKAPYRAAIDSMPTNLVHDLMLDSAMFDWAVRTGQMHVVYLSSSAAYPVEFQRKGHRIKLAEGDIDLADPKLSDAAYGVTKTVGEHMAKAVRAAGVPVTVVRPFSGYGEDQGENWPFGAFIGRAVRREDPFTIWGDSTQVRDWIHIDDVVNGILALVEAGVEEPVNLCTGVPTDMLKMVMKIVAEAGYYPDVKVDTEAPQGVHYRVGDPTLLHRYYTPQVTVEEGIRRALRARGV